MPEAWDTTLVGRIHSDRVLVDIVEDRVSSGDPIAVTAPTLHELAYGYSKALRDGHRGFARLLSWLKRLMTEGRVEVLPFTGPAAMLAGELRGRHRVAPSGGQSGGGSKAEARVAWVIDLQIAATAWTAGRDLTTGNRAHFETIAELISELAPGGSPLRVVSPPSW